MCWYCRGGRDTSEVRHRNIRYTQLLETLLVHFPPVLAKFVLGIKLLPTDVASGLVLFRRMHSSHMLSQVNYVSFATYRALFHFSLFMFSLNMFYQVVPSIRSIIALITHEIVRVVSFNMKLVAAVRRELSSTSFTLFCAATQAVEFVLSTSVFFDIEIFPTFGTHDSIWTGFCTSVLVYPFTSHLFATLGTHDSRELSFDWRRVLCCRNASFASVNIFHVLGDSITLQLLATDVTSHNLYYRDPVLSLFVSFDVNARFPTNVTMGVHSNTFPRRFPP